MTSRSSGPTSTAAGRAATISAWQPPLRAGYDHLFLLNNDALVEPHAIARLLRTAEQESERRPILGAPQLEDDGGNGWFGASDTGTKIFPDICQGQTTPAGCGAVYETAFVKGAGAFLPP